MHASKDELPVVFGDGAFAIRQIEWGDMNVSMESAPAGSDPTPLFKGLPDDRCPCPHWGYLVQGRMRVRYADREEVVNAGETYYLAPGHIVVVEEDVETVEFSPKNAYRETIEVVSRNMEALRR